VILVFVGAKFVAQGFGVQVPITTSLLVILVAIVASIAVSLAATRGNKPGEAQDGPRPAGAVEGSTQAMRDGWKLESVLRNLTLEGI
jgi:hypothetical protein